MSRAQFRLGGSLALPIAIIAWVLRQSLAYFANLLADSALGGILLAF
jgi:hypothetical protein